MLLGNNTGSRAIMLCSVRLRCVGVGFQLDPLVYTHSVDHIYMYTEFHLAQNLSCARNLQNVTTVYVGECL